MYPFFNLNKFAFIRCVVEAFERKSYFLKKWIDLTDRQKNHCTIVQQLFRESLESLIAPLMPFLLRSRGERTFSRGGWKIRAQLPVLQIDRTSLTMRSFPQNPTIRQTNQFPTIVNTVRNSPPPPFLKFRLINSNFSLAKLFDRNNTEIGSLKRRKEKIYAVYFK